ncbi:uncharacterized protein [Panulirus ornatus]|uniref:uncharacterized protein n=1 Tax=Panulirus ornatus TaxID=150431 RepID=UPI003A84AC19
MPPLLTDFILINPELPVTSSSPDTSPISSVVSEICRLIPSLPDDSPISSQVFATSPATPPPLTEFPLDLTSAAYEDRFANYLPPNLREVPRISWARLKLGKTLGSGCYGTVKEAILKRSDGSVVTVAVKEYHSVNDVTEVQSLWELDGAGGVPKLYGVTSTTPMALVMELVPGERLSKFKPQNLGQCLKAFIATCAAVEEIHEAGYVHCDLHSDNILISSRDDGGIISRIIDVGLARNLNSGLSSDQEWMVMLDVERMVHLATVLIARKFRKPLESLFVFQRQLSSLREGAEMFLKAQQ